MARSRNIKPGFFLNDELVELPYEQRLLFIGLWCLADREGRLENRPKKIKMQLFPADDLDMSEAILGLSRGKLITLYAVDNIAYIQIDNFLKHQHPHHKEAESTIPPCTEPDKPEANLGKDGLIPDTLNLIPDTKEPPLSGKPDSYSIVITYLNEQAGTKYQQVESNLKLIRARLKEGRTEDELCDVIDRQIKVWANQPNMQKYLRPETLFNATKFNQYYGQLGMPIQPGENNGQRDTRSRAQKVSDKLDSLAREAIDRGETA